MCKGKIKMTRSVILSEAKDPEILQSSRFQRDSLRRTAKPSF